MGAARIAVTCRPKKRGWRRNQAIAIWRGLLMQKKKLLAPDGWALAAIFILEKIYKVPSPL